jgi:hypothetical protein
MKLNKIIYVLGAAIVMIAAATGCNKNDFNINRNPNQPTDSTVTYDVILPAALHGTGAVVAGNWGFLQNWMGFWARSGTYAPAFAEETYSITTSFGVGVWNNLYNNAYDYQVMMGKAQQADADFYEGIARIMKAHNFQILVDMYNNVPYFDALKGSANVTPRYDAGSAIYKDLFRQLDTAITLIKGATASQSRNITTNDIMFKGDKTSWVRLANTLKLRMLVHLHNGAITTTGVAPGFDVAGEVARITAEGSGYLVAGQNASVQPGYRTDKPNPFWATYFQDATGTTTANSVYYKANEYAIDYYQYDGDPRTTRFYTPGANGLVGVAYGLPPVTANGATNLAGIGPGLLRSADQAQWVVTATESLFLQAEAQQRGIIPGAAATTLRAAITESMSFLGVANPTTAANNYIAANAGYPDVDYTAPSLGGGRPAGGLYTILQQKWFALNGIATYEVYTDWRRTDIVYGVGGGYDPGPPLSVSPNRTVNRIPSRLLYPQTEYNYNAENVGGQGTIDPNGKIFWDLN